MSKQVLSIGSDRKLFEENSRVAARVKEYANAIGDHHIVVFTLRSHGTPNEPTVLAPNVVLYPTNSKSKLGYITDAIKIGRAIMRASNIPFVITTQDPYESGYVGMRLKQISNNPLYVQVHGDFLSPYFVKESFLNSFRMNIALQVLPKADAIRVVSERAKRSIQSKIDNLAPVTVLPIRGELEELQKQKRENIRNKFDHEFLVLMNSRLEEVKNVSLGIKAFAKLLQMKPKAGLIIAGSGTFEEKLKAEVKKLGIQKNVHFVGWVDNVKSYYEAADIFLNTSDHEGYCLTLIEAALFKTPVITTDVGLVGESINENNAFVCPVGDLECIGETLVSVALLPDVREKKAAKAWQQVTNEQMTEEAYIREYKGIFDRVQ